VGERMIEGIRVCPVCKVFAFPYDAKMLYCGQCRAIVLEPKIEPFKLEEYKYPKGVKV